MAFDLHIPMDEHVLIVGQTGCGKTYLTEIYLANVPSMVIKLDVKLEALYNLKQNKTLWHGLNNEDVQIIQSLEELPHVEKDRIIYCPNANEMEFDYYNSLCEWVYTKGDCILWIDELMSICPSANQCLPWLKILYTRGRFINAVVWSCTQRPMEIPNICIANSQHFFVFNTKMPQDRKKLVESTGCMEFYKIPPKYYFTYFRDGMENGVTATLKI